MTKAITKVDGRTKNGTKIDLAKVIQLKEVHNMSYAQIGKQLGYSAPYVMKTYRKFKELLPSVNDSGFYTEHRADLINSVETKMLLEMANEDRLKKASVNNVAYAFQQLHNARRLEQDKSTANVGVSIQSRLSKALKGKDK